MVGFVAALLTMFYLAILMGYSAANFGRTVIWGVGTQFWTATAAMGTAYITFFALAFYASAGMITFTSENRSTPLRTCIIVQQAAFVGWMAYAWIASAYSEPPINAAMTVAGIYWFVMGTLLTAERPGISQRVRRRLPQSFTGRMFCSWLNPGPASGYMFVIANITSLAIMCFLAAIVSSFKATGPSAWSHTDELEYMLLVGWGFIVAYLGVGLLIVSALRKIAAVTMLASVLINFLLVLAGFGAPFAIKSMSTRLRDVDYTFLQITDPYSSLVHISQGVPSDTHVIAIVVPGLAICVLLLNMPRIIAELRVVRESAPARVLQDEVELHPPPEALPQNPWEEPA
jgi:hypothetical protein